MNEEELKKYKERESKRNYMRQYYATHPEALEKKRQLDREYAAKNRDKALAKSTLWYQENREAAKRRANRHQLKAKLKAIAVLGSKCQRCDETHPAALQFHHRDPSTKLFPVTTKQITTPKRFPWEMIVEEIMKCDLLCSNCHAKHHSTWLDEDIAEFQE